MSALVWTLISLLLIATVITGALGFSGTISIVLFVVLFILYWACSAFDYYMCAKTSFNADLTALRATIIRKDEYSEKIWRQNLRSNRIKMYFASIIGPLHGIGVTLYGVAVYFSVFIVAPIVCFLNHLEWKKAYGTD